ncbi:hypothetical protein [Sphingomonas sp. G-3-2-10]|uniref:hypothetical protein n=1 Tax=Sphingomonas sp. G-3-2-10 TaxID=2728838 RepID=UPI00146EB293|nr:hypothetical protein [Sphingomonas sp. G-3-2-10]NML07192.1 hypothetical protein [Sphingomonas sp. G-3-2-10]
MKRIVVLGLMAVASAALAGCGAREALIPPSGKALPVKPYAAKEEPKAADLLAAPPQTRPARSDDLIESSQERRSDDYDLPPPN